MTDQQHELAATKPTLYLPYHNGQHMTAIGIPPKHDLSARHPVAGVPIAEPRYSRVKGKYKLAWHGHACGFHLISSFTSDPDSATVIIP